MAIEVTPARVRATADLARLDLRDDEVGPFVGQLQKILDHIAALDGVDAASVDLNAAGRECPLHDDAPREGVRREEALAQAPRVDHGAFVVPQFVEE